MVVTWWRLTKTQTWVTARTRVTPSFRVRACFRAILLCLILKRVLVAHKYIHEPKIATRWTHLHTVGSVLTTNVSQINLCQLLFRPTLKLRLDSCLSLLLKWTTLPGLHQNECTFPKIHSLSTGGAHSRVEASITSPTSPSYVAKQLTALFHTQPPYSSLGLAVSHQR